MKGMTACIIRYCNCTAKFLKMLIPTPQVQSQTEKDVEKALAAYVKTGKVPTSIMEAR